MLKLPITHVAALLALLLLLAPIKAPTAWGSGWVEDQGSTGDDEEINFEACQEAVCDPLRIIRHTIALKYIRAYYRQYNRPMLPLSLEAKMMVISNSLRQVFKEVDFIGFYYLNKDRSTTELEIAPYSTIIKTPIPFVKKGEGIVGKVWEKEEPIFVRDLSKIKGYETFDGRARSELAIPCFDQNGQIFAVFYAASELEKVFEETDIICYEEILNYLDY